MGLASSPVCSLLGGWAPPQRSPGLILQLDRLQGWGVWLQPLFLGPVLCWGLHCLPGQCRLCPSGSFPACTWASLHPPASSSQCLPPDPLSCPPNPSSPPPPGPWCLQATPDPCPGRPGLPFPLLCYLHASPALGEAGDAIQVGRATWSRGSRSAKPWGAPRLLHAGQLPRRSLLRSRPLPLGAGPQHLKCHHLPPVPSHRGLQVTAHCWAPRAWPLPLAPALGLASAWASRCSLALAPCVLVCLPKQVSGHLQAPFLLHLQPDQPITSKSLHQAHTLFLPAYRDQSLPGQGTACVLTSGPVGSIPPPPPPIQLFGPWH